MTFTARTLLLPAVIFLAAGCRHVAPAKSRPPAVATEPIAPSPRLILGRLVALDAAQGFAFIELAADAPGAALVEGTELLTRTADLRETGRLQASRHMRGRTLGARIVAGQPTPGDEVVWLAP